MPHDRASDPAPDLDVAAPPYDHNPSSWRQRIPICVLALVAAGIAGYMACFQWGLVPTAWDPFFGEQSAAVLHSDVAQAMHAWLRIPDAALGALAYLGDALFGLAGSTRRWQYRPWMVVLFGLDVASWHIGIGLTRMANATLFGNAGSLILMVWGFIAWRRLPRGREWPAMAAAIGGAAILMGHSFEISPATLAGDLFCLLAGVLYAGYLLILQGARKALGHGDEARPVGDAGIAPRGAQAGDQIFALRLHSWPILFTP